MEYSIGWKAPREIVLFGKPCTITVKVQAYEPDDIIPPVQEDACRQYAENEADLLKTAEELMKEFSGAAETRFSPRRLLFTVSGECALLCDDAEDEDEGIAVCLLPEKTVEYQSDFL